MKCFFNWEGEPVRDPYHVHAKGEAESNMYVSDPTTASFRQENGPSQ